MSKILVVLLLSCILFIYAGVTDAISCQNQGNARGAQCVWGDCPSGWRSVFWDSGCTSYKIGNWIISEQRCCI
ncbi:hypothetical protein HA402_004993 [Bradysia odoriphaga]|nr:hypothetical protein HA402_004993 [Bradysia odoriphaga]